MIKMPGKPAHNERTVSTYCYQCVAGPDLLTVGRGRRGDRDRAELRRGCRASGRRQGVRQGVRAGAEDLQPESRCSHPMKRTNPKKGRDEDPGFVPISWDEALALVADKLNAVRAEGLTDESAIRASPRASAAAARRPVLHGHASRRSSRPGVRSTWASAPARASSAITPSTSTASSGIARFTVSPDTPLCNYLVSFGANVEASGGVFGVWRHADARVRGMKRVQVEPHLSVTGACSAEWVPIKPKTDAAFLFAMIHVLLHEHAARAARSSVPQAAHVLALSGRAAAVCSCAIAATRKPLCDRRRDRPRGAVRHPGHRPGSGRHVRRRRHRDRCRRRDHVAEGADGETGVRAAGRTCEALFAGMGGGDLRRAGGHHPPHRQRIPRPRVRRRDDRDRRQDAAVRPVAVSLGKTVNNGWGGYECCWARTLLGCLVGALEVPGGTLGTTVRLNRPADNRWRASSRAPTASCTTR